MQYFGKMRGIVFDNNDPEKLLRIKPIVPAISSKPLNWALPCKDYLGKNCGDIDIPGKKDGVWIEFEGGDVNFPICVGMWASAVDVPAEFLASYNENTKISKDKNGNIIKQDVTGILIDGVVVKLGKNAIKQLVNNLPACIFSTAPHILGNTNVIV